MAEISLAEANQRQVANAKGIAYEDMGLEYQTRVPILPKDDEELQAILSREREHLSDEKVPVSIQKELDRITGIEHQIEKILYKAEITGEHIYEIGLLTVLSCYHLERIELGDKNPIARDLLQFFNKLKT